MRVAQLLSYAISGHALRDAATVMRHRVGPGHDVIFLAGSQVDLQWVIPAYNAARERGLDCAFAGPNLATPGGARYVNLPVQLFPFLRARAVVTATSGLKTAHMPRNAQFRIAVPHSLVSLHAVYPKGTFDAYTDVFCCGAHHVAEIEAMNRTDGKDGRRPALIGYAKFERLMETRPKNAAESDGRKHILIGPSWGKGNILETIGVQLLARLLAEDYRVTLRPHPSFFVFGDAQLASIIEKWRGHEAFTLENSVEESRALWEADLMIADYSGFAMEFAFMRERPVLYIDVPSKVLNPDWKATGLTPIELSIRSRIGTVVAPDVDMIVDGLRTLEQEATQWSDRIRKERDDVWANFGRFGDACADELSCMLAKVA